MNWRKLVENKTLKLSLAGLGVSTALGTVVYFGQPVFKEMNSSFAMKEFKKHGVVSTYRNHYHKFFDKVQSLADADLHHEDLVREMASLQKQLEVERMKNAEHEARTETEHVAEQIKTEAGSEIAHIPDSIEYEIPTQLLPHQLLVLGMGYFRKQDYEKSAVIFHELVHLKEERGFQRADNYLISAISWYKLKHFEMANDYLKLTQQKAEAGSEIYRQSLLWQAMLEKARGNQVASQKVLSKLISLYPQSTEVAWVNGSARKPASKKEHAPAEHGGAHHE